MSDSAAFEMYVQGSALSASKQILAGVVMHELVDNPDEIDPSAESARLATAQVVDLSFVSESYNPAVDELVAMYPYRYFPIKRQAMEGQGVIPATTESRLRTTFKAIQETFPEIEPMDNETAKRTYQKFQQLTKQRVTGIPGKPDLTRAELMHPHEALEKMLSRYGRLNHPLAQVIFQIREEYPELPRGIMRDFESRLLTAYSYNDIAQLYKRLIAKARQTTA